MHISPQWGQIQLLSPPFPCFPLPPDESLPVDDGGFPEPEPSLEKEESPNKAIGNNLDERSKFISVFMDPLRSEPLRNIYVVKHSENSNY